MNPEIFYRYSVFKAWVASFGKKWDGSFSDFIDLATKYILSVSGMYRYSLPGEDYHGGTPLGDAGS